MKSEWTDRISIHPDEFFLLWFAHHKLRDLPAFLGVNPVGRYRDERAECTAAASKELASRGLGTIENPAEGLLEIVDQLAEAPVRLEFSLTGSDVGMWTVGAVQDSQAAVAARTATEIRLWTQEASGLVSSLIQNLPPMESGTGTSANVPVADFEHAREAGAVDGTWAFREALLDAGVHSSEVPTIMRAVEDSYGGGTLAAMRRDDAGDWRHMASQMSWVDTATGCYAIRQADDWVTVTPAGSTRLKSMCGDLLEQLELPV